MLRRFEQQVKCSKCETYAKSTCTDPESVFRGGPIFYVFLVDKGREDPNTNISGPSSARQRNAISMAYRWRADNGPPLYADLAAL